MNDLLHKALKMLDHNRYAVVGVALAALMMVAAFGCEVTTTSPITGEQVTQQELQAELAEQRSEYRARAAEIEGQLTTLQERASAVGDESVQMAEGYQLAFEDIQQKEQMIQRSIEAVGAIASEYAGPAVEPILMALGLGGASAGAGIFADNRRKDKVIESQKRGRESGDAAIEGNS